MATKIDAKEEKRQRNEVYADSFKTKKEKKGRRGTSRFLNWCRTLGHVPSCQCTYK